MAFQEVLRKKVEYLPQIFLNSFATAPLDLDSLWNAWLTSNHNTIPRITQYAALQQHADKMLTHLLPREFPHRNQTGLLLATTKGDIDAEVRWLRSQDSPHPTNDSPPTLAQQAAHFARAVNVQGPTYTISTACSSGLIALIDAALTLLDGHATHILALGIDVAGDFVHDGFTSLKAISPTACRPFDTYRDGLMLGSAAAACLLSLTPTKSSCILSGWGIASDATHMTAPDRNASGLITAMQNALASARLAPADIDLLLAHGTATRYNDSMEATAIDAVFRPSRREKGPAITAVKGLIGHTLGTSGLIESALAAKILEHQLIPPITGLQTPERPDLDLITTPRPQKITHIMKVAAGFGGLNAAIILSKIPEAQK